MVFRHAAFTSPHIVLHRRRHALSRTCHSQPQSLPQPLHSPRANPVTATTTADNTEASPSPLPVQNKELQTADANTNANANASTTPKVTYRANLLNAVTDLSKTEWDDFATAGNNSPFVRHDWLRCLEESGSATEEKGWKPCHIALYNTETEDLTVLAPAYLKYHSMGEFVFDQEWAEAAYNAGIEYYPKLLLGIPFTPATDRRIFTPRLASTSERARLLRLMANVLVQIAHSLRVSSVHVNFCSEDEVSALRYANFHVRKGVQYHFTNYRKGSAAITALEAQISAGKFDLSGKGNENNNIENDNTEQASAPHKPSDADANADAPFGLQKGERTPYRDFEDYLGDFRSKRRIKMRRERHVVRNEHGLQIEVVQGDAIDTATMLKMYDIYKSTIDKLLYGRQYLTREFFQMLAECAAFKQNVCLILARRSADGEIMAGTFNVLGGGDDEGGVFYGRYWGCLQEYRYLHFEACYYAAIEYCIDEGLARMEPGAGGGDFKYMRGFEPSVTRSMHFMRDERLSDAVARYLYLETKHIEGAVTEMKKQSAIRCKKDPREPNEPQRA